MDGHKNKAMPVEFRTGKQKVGGGGGYQFDLQKNKKKSEESIRSFPGLDKTGTLKGTSVLCVRVRIGRGPVLI